MMKRGIFQQGAAAWGLRSFFSVLLACTPAAALTGGQRCTAAKLRAAGADVMHQMRCQIAATRAGTAVDPACLTRAAAKFARAFQRAEGTGECITSGDAAAIEAQADTFLTAVVAAIPASLTPPPSPAQRRCAAAKYRRAARKAYDKATCYAKAARAGSAVAARCISGAEHRFDTAFAVAERRGECAISDNAAAVEAEVDGFVSAIVSALPAIPPTPTPTATATPGPISSDLGAAPNGGGCYPTALTLSSPVDMLTLVNPEWAPVVNGQLVDSIPVLAQGTIVGGHGDTGGDYPGTHARSDVNTFVSLDDPASGLYATGNPDEIAFEWEAGAYPDWAWGGAGDRIVGLGRRIFDCGHPGSLAGHCSLTTNQGCALNSECPAGETCIDPHFRYQSEIHPPFATAVMRFGRGAVLDTSPATTAVPATRTDVFISPNGGAAGDACIAQHLANPLTLTGTECYPLSQPLAAAHLNDRDFDFEVPLPARPPGGHALWRIQEYATPGAVAPAVEVVPFEDDPAPYLAVHVRLTQSTPGGLPTGYAGTLFAGWDNDPTPLTHVRVTLDAVVIRNALQLLTPVVPRICSGNGAACNTTADCPSGQTCSGVGPVKSWRLQVALNNEWRELSGLSSVSSGDVIAQGVTFDQYLPADGGVQISADGVSEDCISTMFGKSLAREVTELGVNDLQNCLLSTPHDPGRVNVSYPGPSFGAPSGVMDYETQSVGGDGGTCSVTSTRLCVVGADCPSGETCHRTGGAFALRYRIERLP